MSQPKYKCGSLLQREGSGVSYMITAVNEVDGSYVYDLTIMGGLPDKQYQHLNNIREKLLEDNAVFIVNKS
jgi:hypothetical protein